MINAGTVGAYLELDISGFTSSLATAGQMLEKFRADYDDDFRGAGGLGNAILEGLKAPMLAVEKFAGVFSGAFSIVRNDAELTSGVIGGIGESARGAAEAASGLYSGEIQSAAGSVAEAVRRVSSALSENGDAWRDVADEEENGAKRIAFGAINCAESVRGAFSRIPDATRSYMTSSVNGMRNALASGRASLFEAAKSDGAGILNGIESVLGGSSGSGGMRGAGTRAVNSIIGGMQAKSGAAVSAVKSVMQSMVTAAGAVSFTGIGGGIVSGILKGINDNAPRLLSKATSLATGIAGVIGGALRINSPSKVMIPMGEAVAEGMEVGLLNGAGSLYETASAISLETAETLGSISTRGVNYASVHSMNYGDRLDRLLDAVERLADSQTTMEIDGRPFGRLVREFI